MSQRSLKFSNRWMFNRVMCRKEVCARVLHAALGIQVGEIRYLNAEQAKEPTAASRGVRMDVFAKDDGRVYDVEMDENVAKLLDEILTGEEYKEKNKITSYVNMDNISYIQITGLEEEYYYYDYDSAAYDEYEEQVKNSGGMAVIKNPKVIKELLNKLDEDTSGYGYIHNNSSITYMEGIANIEIFFEKSKKKKNQDIIGITLYKYNNNALAYLSEMGYGFIVGENEG